MGIKDRRTKILLSLLLNSDSSSSFKSLNYDKSALEVFDLTLNRKTKKTFDNLEKEKLIEKTSKEKDEYSYKLTAEGFEDITLTFPVFRFRQHKWDHKWRILSYEIPEKKRELRDRLRREVASWGLGPWHRSFWLTPHPIIPYLKSLVKDKEEETYIQAFEADHSFGDKNILIEKVWGTAKLEDQYRKMFKKWHEILSKDKDKTQKFKAVVNEYIKILKVDPGLPKELLGDKWIGYEAINLFNEIKAILLR